MSLNRVASIETLADYHVRRGSDAGHRPRKLSFSPVPQPWDPPHPPLSKTISGHDHFYERRSSSPHPEQPRLDVDAGPVSAFEVPQWKRIRKSRLKCPGHIKADMTRAFVLHELVLAQHN
jgi:hypothetical protein